MAGERESTLYKSAMASAYRADLVAANAGVIYSLALRRCATHKDCCTSRGTDYGLPRADKKSTGQGRAGPGSPEQGSRLG